MRSDGESRPFHTLRTEVSLRIFPLRPQRFAAPPAFLSRLTGTTARRKRTALPTHSPEHTDRHTPCFRQSSSTGKHFRNRPRTALKNLRNGSVFDGRTCHCPVIKSVSPKPHFRRTRSGRQRPATSYFPRKRQSAEGKAGCFSFGTLLYRKYGPDGQSTSISNIPTAASLRGVRCSRNASASTSSAGWTILNWSAATPKQSVT